MNADLDTNDSGSPVQVAEPEETTVLAGGFGVVLRLLCVVAVLALVSVVVLRSVDRGGARIASPAVSSLATATFPKTQPAKPASAAQPARTAIFPSLPQPSRIANTPMGAAAPRRLDVSPVDLCKAISVGSKPGGWAPSEVFETEWECLSQEVVKAASGKGAASGEKTPGYRLFAMARGTREDDVRYVRFKAIAKTEAGADKSAELLASRVAALFRSAGWALPDRVAESTRLRHPFQIDDQGTSIHFFKEQTDPFSYNLIIGFPKPLAAEIAAEAANETSKSDDAEAPAAN